MGMTAAFARWGTAARRAAFARPHVFPVLGRGGRPLWLALLDSAPVVPAAGLHDADLLVLAGAIPESWAGPLSSLFDTLGLPRGAIWLRPSRATPPPPLPLLGSFEAGELAEVDWAAVIALLLDPARPPHDPFLPEHPPLWLRERSGPAGEPGGAVPVELARAALGEDPDGLALDELPIHLGPFFPGLPSGLALRLRVQGERVHACDRIDNLFPPQPVAAVPAPLTVGELEANRIESHMAWMADLLDFSGLRALADAFRAARRGVERPWLERLFRAARRSGLKELQQGMGVISREQALELDLAGPVARACGLARDARLDDPVYLLAGFFPQMEEEGDNWARWRVRERECRESLRLIEVAGGERASSIEGARGAGNGSRSNLAALSLLPGMGWTEALHFIASLDLAMEEAAAP